MDTEVYNEWLRELSVIRQDVRSAIDSLPIEITLSVGPQALESEKQALSDSYKIFGNLISKLEVNLDREVDEDVARLEQLANIRKEVGTEVLEYKKLIADEYETMRKREKAD